MTLTLIAAVGPKMELGCRGNLAYSLRDDMAHFKATTTGHPVIMGRLTFESFPKGALPGRTNIVVTRNAAFSAPGVLVAPDIERAVELAAGSPGAEETFVIGGGEIYRQMLPLASRLILTEVEVEAPEADTFFPAIGGWKEESRTPRRADSRSNLPYTIAVYSNNS